MLCSAAVLWMPTDDPSLHKFRICCHLLRFPYLYLPIISIETHSALFLISNFSHKLSSYKSNSIASFHPPSCCTYGLPYSCTNLILHWNKGPHKAEDHHSVPWHPNATKNIFYSAELGRIHWSLTGSSFVCCGGGLIVYILLPWKWTFARGDNNYCYYYYYKYNFNI